MRNHRRIFNTIPGILAMFGIAVFAMGGADLGFPQWKGLQAIFASFPLTNKILVESLHFNYILICIFIGMIIRNLFGVPQILLPGIRTSRLFIKTGVILLGSIYSISEVVDLGLTAILMVLFFVFFTMFLTLYLGRKAGMNPSSAAVLAAGTAICGVSAIVAAAPACRAKTSDVVYSIGTILSVGLIFLFTFPLIGSLLDLSYHQFGVWAGTGIVNSGQVLAATLAYDPGNIHHVSISLKTGEIYNITRVLLLPFVVIILAVYSSQHNQDIDYNVNTSLWNKFPLFIIGFLLVVAMTSVGLLGSTSPPSQEIITIRKLYQWFFAIGLVGLSMQISFDELRRAGGKPLQVGIAAAVVKAVGALIIVVLFIK